MRSGATCLLLLVIARPSPAQDLDFSEFSDTTVRANNPLLIMGFGGANRYVRYLAAEPDERKPLGLFDRPYVFGPILLLVVLAHLKGYIPTAAFVLKKPCDAAAYLLHIGAGPLGLAVTAARVFDAPAEQANAAHYAGATLAVIGLAFVFIVVWTVSSTIDGLIALSPVSAIDPVLKWFRVGVIAIICLAGQVHPALGFAAALVVFLVCLALFHFAVRCTVVSLSYSLGVVGRLLGVRPPDGTEVRGFSCWGFRGVPLWSRGRLRRGAEGLEFVYRRLFICWTRAVPLPAELAVARGTINPFLRDDSGERAALVVRFSPLYYGREPQLCKRLSIDQLADVSLQTSLIRLARAAWGWVTGPLRRRPGAPHVA
jgi:hypothetical protein